MAYDKGIGTALMKVAQRAKRAGGNSLYEVATAIRDRMREEAPPPKRPIRWDSDKQRRAFFATNGFGGGIPHKRTHKYRNAWTTRRITAGVTLSNKHRAAGAIGGVPKTGWQSKIHRGTWNYFPKVFAQEIAKLPRIVIENLRIEFR